MKMRVTITDEEGNVFSIHTLDRDAACALADLYPEDGNEAVSNMVSDMRIAAWDVIDGRGWA